jgi:hypothetical protein
MLPGLDPGFRRGSVHVGCRREQRCFFLELTLADPEHVGMCGIP